MPVGTNSAAADGEGATEESPAPYSLSAPGVLRCDRAGVVQLLLDHGASVDFRDSDGRNGDLLSEGSVRGALHEQLSGGGSLAPGATCFPLERTGRTPSVPSRCSQTAIRRPRMRQTHTASSRTFYLSFRINRRPTVFRISPPHVPLPPHDGAPQDVVLHAGLSHVGRHERSTPIWALSVRQVFMRTNDLKDFNADDKVSDMPARTVKTSESNRIKTK